MLGKFAALLMISLAMTSVASAHHKPGHQIPPGQMKKLYVPDVVIPQSVQYVCLVTTEIAGDPYSRVVYSEWLPRSAAEAKANLGKSFIIYHPTLNTEAGCADF